MNSSRITSPIRDATDEAKIWQNEMSRTSTKDGRSEHGCDCIENSCMTSGGELELCLDHLSGNPGDRNYYLTEMQSDYDNPTN